MPTTTGVNDATSTAAASTYIRKDTVANNSTLSMDDFWKLLAAQLKYQDMTNPMSNSEMMNQLTQMASMSAMDSMSTTVNSTMSNMAQITLSTYATTLLGQEITVADVDKNGELIGQTTGVVEGLSLTGSNPYLYINGKAYNLSQIMTMGKVPSTEDGGDVENGGENGAPVEPDTDVPTDSETDTEVDTQTPPVTEVETQTQTA